MYIFKTYLHVCVYINIYIYKYILNIYMYLCIFIYNIYLYNFFEMWLIAIKWFDSTNTYIKTIEIYVYINIVIFLLLMNFHILASRPLLVPKVLISY